MRLAVDAAPDPTWFAIAGDGTVLDASESATHLMGRRIFDVHPDQREMCEPYHQHARKYGRAEWDAVVKGQAWHCVATRVGRRLLIDVVPCADDEHPFGVNEPVIETASLDEELELLERHVLELRAEATEPRSSGSPSEPPAFRVLPGGRGSSPSRRTKRALFSVLPPS